MQETKNRSCCFTGHRIIRKQDIEEIGSVVQCEILRLAEQEGILNFISGGALGFDMLAAEMVLYLRERSLPDITLELMLPCRNQDAKWREADKARYAQILERADKVSYISEEYTPRCMLARNRAMVDASEHCVAYIYKSFGGTAYTVRYVNEQGKGITML